MFMLLQLDSSCMIGALNVFEAEMHQQSVDKLCLMSFQVLEGLGLNMDQFVDLCILCGCDYCDTIRG